MCKHLTKEKISAGQTVYGIVCGVCSSEAVEVLGLTGFDFVVIDAEHAPLGVKTCVHLIELLTTFRSCLSLGWP